MKNGVNDEIRNCSRDIDWGLLTRMLQEKVCISLSIYGLAAVTNHLHEKGLSALDDDYHSRNNNASQRYFE